MDQISFRDGAAPGRGHSADRTQSELQIHGPYYGPGMGLETVFVNSLNQTTVAGPWQTLLVTFHKPFDPLLAGFTLQIPWAS